MNEPLGEERLVVIDLGRIGGMTCAVDDLGAVGRVEGTAVVTDLVGQADDVGAVEIHRVDVEVAVAHRREDDAIGGG